jgi:hypothetical protein
MKKKPKTRRKSKTKTAPYDAVKKLLEGGGDMYLFFNERKQCLHASVRFAPTLTLDFSGLGFGPGVRDIRMVLIPNSRGDAFEFIESDN